MRKWEGRGKCGRVDGCRIELLRFTSYELQSSFGGGKWISQSDAYY